MDSDIEPPGVKCLPVVTHILNSGQTSGIVKWTLPEVYDNSGSAILYNISGPVPNDTLRVGQYIAQYRSEDDEGNLSPVCTMSINVQGRLQTTFPVFIAPTNWCIIKQPFYFTWKVAYFKFCLPALIGPYA